MIALCAARLCAGMRCQRGHAFPFPSARSCDLPVHSLASCHRVLLLPLTLSPKD
uniref:Uncharacterized protein n=1 Tax=uncultured marine virus TaxID=186617 RepID=A0A0F7L5M7_9VIRU|nr:hypothetical protein [uncultured marine virus]